MENRGLSTLLDYLRRELPLPGADSVPDGDLLTRLVASKDEAAFELLVRRHGPMVFNTARRILRNAHSAEDVLQATFLALARQAKSLRRQSSIAGWLYRVTVRIAYRARKTSELRMGSIVAEHEPSALLMQNELRAALDNAIDRLPEKLRRAVVLCYVSGHTTEQAARLLDCPKGTVLSRLAAAREKLQAELTRKGIVVSATTLTTVLTNELGSAALPAALVAMTMKVIGPMAALTPIVITLAQGAVAMSWMKMALAAIIVVSTGFGAAIAVNRNGNQDKPESKPLPPIATTEKTNAEHRFADLENQIVSQIRTAADRRIELKVRVAQLKRKVDDLKTALEVARSLGNPNSRGWQILFNVDPQTVKHMIKPDHLGSPELATKVMSKLDDNERELIATEEELRAHDELAAIRLDLLKRKLGLTP